MNFDYRKWLKKVWEHLKKFRKTRNKGIDGNRQYEHILFVKVRNNRIDKKEQVDVIVKKGGLIDTVKILNFTIFDSLHPKAHYLGSSQLACYNFFRPLLDTEDITKLVKDLDLIKKERNATIKEFEYHIPGYDRFDGIAGDTNFDFFYGNNDEYVSFEIKYTEEHFVSKEKRDLKGKYGEKYKNYVKKNFTLKKVPSPEEFYYFYQFFRNVMWISDKKLHKAVFICPKDRKDLINEFEEWKEEFIKPNIIVRLITWEKMVESLRNIGKYKHADEFEKRYLKY